MADFGSTITNVASGAGNVGEIIVWIVVILAVAFILIGLAVLLWWKKKRWNLDVEIKLTRGDGRITHGEWGKGFYDSRRGVVLIRRPNSKKAVAMKIFDVRRYMQGSRLLTVIQVGPEDFRPVLSDSWTENSVDYIDETKPMKDDLGNNLLGADGKQLFHKTTVKEAIINIKADTGKDKAWRVAWEEASKNAYTIRSFIREHSVAISVSIVVICCFVGFAILWTKLSTVCS